ncbi:MAG: ABC transporter permease [Anaerolineae bacterium]
MVVRNLWRRKTRTFLTLLGVAVGIAAIVTLVALSRGVASSYVEATSRSDADVTLQAVQSQGQALTIGTGFDQDLIEKLRRMPEVKSASGVLYTLVRMPSMPYFVVFGYEPDQAGIRHFRVIEGVTLAEHRTRRGGKPILIGKTAADNLDVGVDDALNIEGVSYRVVGIYETGVALEDAAGIVPLEDAQALAGMPRQVMYIGLQLQHPERVDEFVADIEPTLPRDVEVAGTQKGSMLLDMLNMLDLFAWAVSMVAALVGGVGMMNTMLMSVFERTREIGVLRAVGWSSRRVLGMILGESLLLSLVGGLLGLGVGAASVWLVSNLPALAGYSEGTVPPELVIQALSATLVLGLVGGAYPAWRASQLPPVEALSYDGGYRQSKPIRLPFGGLAMKNLLRQRTRTMLTLVGLGIAISGMLITGSLTEGAVASFGDSLATTEITAVEAGLADSSLSAIDERTLKRIEVLPEVQYVTGVLLSAVSTPSQPFFVITARSRGDPALNERILREGQLITGRRQCLLGWRAAAEQKKQVGDRIAMLGTSFTVVGIVEVGTSFEDNGAIIELREAQQLLKKPRQVMFAQIKLVRPENADAVIAQLSNEYPALSFSKSAEFMENLPDMQSAQSSVFAVYAMTVLIGSIALMNTMIMSVYERTREIGVLRAVGWRSSLVLRQMLAESVLVTLLSGLVGLVGTLALIVMVRAIPAAGVMRELFVVTPSLMVQALLLCLFLGVLGGLYPAWRATRLSPVEALRYE